MNSLVSIIIPTYNRAHLIGETLNSVLAQTYTNWECIVVDDGSTDYTEELLEFYCKRDSRIQYYHRPGERTRGANTCRNYGFEQSKGEYIQWLDSDDLLGAVKIEKQVAEIKKVGSAIIFCSWVTYKDFIENKINGFKPTQKNFGNFDFFENLENFGGFLPLHCYLTPKTFLYKSGLWNESLLINQDGEFFNRLILSIDNLIFSDGLVIYRMADDYARTSNYDKQDKLIDLIYSWKIIEGYHKIKYKINKESGYIRFSKNYLYKVIEPVYPELIIQNQDFFKQQIRKECNKKSLIFRLRRKIKHIFKTLKK